MTVWERTQERAGRARPVQRQEGACRLEAGATRGCGGLRRSGLGLRRPGRLVRPTSPGRSVGPILLGSGSWCCSFCCSFKKDRDCVFARVALTIHKNKGKTQEGRASPAPTKARGTQEGGVKPPLHRSEDAGIGEASLESVLEEVVCACGFGHRVMGVSGGGYSAY